MHILSPHSQKLPTFKKKSPVIAGIDIKKEKLAFFRENPHNSPKIVEPERDIPEPLQFPHYSNIMAWCGLIFFVDEF